MHTRILKVVLDVPLHFVLDYCWEALDHAQRLPVPGQLVVVEFGKRMAIGLIVEVVDSSAVALDKLKTVSKLVDELPPFASTWLAFCQFAATYYQRPLGEAMLASLPKQLRSVESTALPRNLAKLAKQSTPHDPATHALPVLNPAQQRAADAIASASGYAPMLLYGVTGSGKTEVYLHAAAQRLQLAQAQAGSAQILILIPEINLTPQLEASVRARFPGVSVVTLHSGLAEGARLRNWLAAHLGSACIILGTRLAIMASLPNLRLIIVDEEHDPSYKQQEGMHYSARDLAVWRAHQLGIPVVLGSATPSLETWQHAQSGRYQLLELRQRAVSNALLPSVSLLDIGRETAIDGLTPSLTAAIKRRLQCGEQTLLFLNRRGYAPVLACEACGWVSGCTRCTAFMVLHKPEQRLRCHHCGLERAIPRACPTCGNVDLQPLGRGTQRIEERLQAAFPDARILRIDADSTRRKGSAQAAFEQVHRGDVDILIGTQMVAKGHDFQNLTLVGVLNPDTALFSHDYRASERLFAQLMQVAGRAGRSAQKEGGCASQVLIQTRYPEHPLYAAVVAHDYERFAAGLLAERKQATLPPFMHQALLRAESRQLATALDFLQQAAASAARPRIVVNDPVPMTITKVANVERAQLLIESTSRPALQEFLTEWLAALRAVKTRVRWSLEVDPVDI